MSAARPPEPQSSAGTSPGKKRRLDPFLSSVSSSDPSDGFMSESEMEIFSFGLANVSAVIGDLSSRMAGVVSLFKSLVISDSSAETAHTSPVNTPPSIATPQRSFVNPSHAQESLQLVAAPPQPQQPPSTIRKDIPDDSWSETSNASQTLILRNLSIPELSSSTSSTSPSSARSTPAASEQTGLSFLDFSRPQDPDSSLDTDLYTEEDLVEISLEQFQQSVAQKVDSSSAGPVASPVTYPEVPRPVAPPAGRASLLPWRNRLSVADEQLKLVDLLTPEFKSYEKIKEERRKLRETIRRLKESFEREVISPLPPEYLEKVKAAYRASDAQGVLAEEPVVTRVELYARDFQTIKGHNWFNDNIIDFYLGLVTKRSRENPALPKVFCWTTHFHSKLLQHDFKALAKWVKRKKLNVTALDYMFVPMNRGGTHWYLCVVNNVEKQFDFYDSLGGSPGRDLEALEMFMEHCASNLVAQGVLRLEEKEDYSAYAKVNVRDSPRQTNAFDCGAFTCKSAEVIARGKPLTYTQRDMPLIRLWMTYEILTGRLIN